MDRSISSTLSTRISRTAPPKLGAGGAAGAVERCGATTSRRVEIASRTTNHADGTGMRQRRITQRTTKLHFFRHAGFACSGAIIAEWGTVLLGVDGRLAVGFKIPRLRINHLPSDLLEVLLKPWPGVLAFATIDRLHVRGPSTSVPCRPSAAGRPFFHCAPPPGPSENSKAHMPLGEGPVWATWCDCSRVRLSSKPESSGTTWLLAATGIDAVAPGILSSLLMLQLFRPADADSPRLKAVPAATRGQGGDQRVPGAALRG